MHGPEDETMYIIATSIVNKNLREELNMDALDNELISRCSVRWHKLHVDLRSIDSTLNCFTLAFGLQEVWLSR